MEFVRKWREFLVCFIGCTQRYSVSSSYGTKMGRRSDKACMSLFSSATQLMELSLRNCRAAFRSAVDASPDARRSRKWAASAPWSEARVSSVALWLNYNVLLSKGRMRRVCLWHG